MNNAFVDGSLRNNFYSAWFIYIYFDVKYSLANYIYYKLNIFFNEKIIQHPVKKRKNYHRLRKQDTFLPS